MSKEKLRTYKVSETKTKAYIYKVQAYTGEEAINQVQENKVLKESSFTTDVFYQIEDVEGSKK